MFSFSILFILQLVVVVHVFKTGRNFYWIYAIMFLPGVGLLAYFIVEILPEFSNSYTGKRTRSKVTKLINPNGDFKNATINLDTADTIENTVILADQCLQKERYREASDLYQKCLKGMYENEPRFLQGWGTAEFYLGHYEETKRILDDLIAKNPTYKDANAHLIFARTIEALGQTDEALKEYKTLINYYPGPEATYHYALLLKKLNRKEEAIVLLENIISKAKRLNKHYQRLHGEWIKKTKEEYKRSSQANW